MRNDTNDSSNNKTKFPTPLGKGIINRLKDLGSQKNVDDLEILNKKSNYDQVGTKSRILRRNSSTEKSTVPGGPKLLNNPRNILTSNQKNDLNRPYTTLKFSTNDAKSSVHKAKLVILDNDKVCPELKHENIRNFTKLLDEKPNNHFNNMKSISEDSRITGGGVQLELRSSNKIEAASRHSLKNKKHDTLPLTKKNSIDTNCSPKVSFKTKNTSRKPIYCIKTNTNTTKVAALAQKFEKNISKDAAEHIQTGAQCKSDHKNNTPNTNADVRLVKNNKFSTKGHVLQKQKTISISSIDKIKIPDSPLSHRKVVRLKSDTTAKKRNTLRKKSSEINKIDVLVTKNERDKENNDSRLDATDVKNTKINLKARSSFKTSPTGEVGSVRAAIQKIESEKNQISNVSKTVLVKSETLDTNDSVVSNAVILKPKVPEKKINTIKTKNLIIKDGKPKIKILRTNNIENAKTDACHTNNTPTEHEIKTEMKDLNIQTEPEISHRIDNQALIKSDDVIKPDRIGSPFVKPKPCPVRETIDKTIKALDRKRFHYEKTCPNILKNECLKLPNPSSINYVDLDIDKDAVNLYKIECDDNENIKRDTRYIEISNTYTESTDDELTEEIYKRMKPNESFLWRSNLKMDPSTMSTIKENEVIVFSSDVNLTDLYEVVPPQYISSSSDDSKVEDDLFTFENLLKKTDQLLDSKKKEIANDLKKDKDSSQNIDNEINEAVNVNVKLDDCVVETVNILTISNIKNIQNNMNIQFIDEDYETFEPFELDNKSSDDLLQTKKETTNSYSKANCPLPEVPKESHDDSEEDIERHENIYQCLSHRDDDSYSMHSYECCSNKSTEDNDCIDKNDNDDDYEYCKSLLNNANCQSGLLSLNKTFDHYDKGFSLLKSDSITSSVGYEKISSIYEKNPPKPKWNNNSENMLLHDDAKRNYGESNCEENIYDVIKPSDTASISNCYESIPESPRYNRKKHMNNDSKLPLQLINKHISYDTISNFSLSTISSDQKTNSIYGQRSIVSYHQAPSEISLSDKSEDWEDMSDQDKANNDTKVIIIREKSRGKHSPASWSRKVRKHNKTARKSSESDLFVSSPSIVYIATSKVAKYYSDNDDMCQLSHDYQNVDLVFRVECEKLLKAKDLSGLAVLKLLVLHDNAFETQETNMLIDVDSSDGEHLYEPIFHSAQRPDAKDNSVPSDEDFDSFESDIECDPPHFNQQKDGNDNIEHPQLPDPPVLSNIYTLTRIATAAGKKMRQFKKNLTMTRKKPSNDKSPEQKQPNPLLIISRPEKKHSAAEISSPKIENINPYQNISLPVPQKENEINPILHAEDKMRISSSNSVSNKSGQDSPIPSESNYSEIMNTSNQNSSENNDNNKKAKNKTKTYLSFKSKFRRSLSVANNPPSPLSPMQTSTFYLSDPMFTTEPNNKLEEQTSKSFTSSNQTIVPTKSNEEFVDKQHINDENSKCINNNRKSLPGNFDLSTPKIPSRPTRPPPPPPDDAKKSKKDRKFSNGTKSWYAECGLFNLDTYKLDSSNSERERSSSTSWYAEIGLYQASNVSTSSGASSTLSGSGTCSTTTAFSSPSTPTPPLGMFNQEQLYQFYNAEKLESVCRDLGNDFDSDNYEEISQCTENDTKPIQRPPAMTFISPHRGPSRTLWCEIPEVVNSGILDTLSLRQKKLQEAKFEIIASEASYLNSLTVLESHYINNSAFDDEKILTKTDKQILFGNINPVKKCSERLMAELETCWQESILLNGLCKIVKHHADKYFHVYISYLENQMHLIKTLKKLKLDPKFNEISNNLQSQPVCQSLALDSFLLLPMQRVTRLPLLLDAILKYLDNQSEEFNLCVETLTSLNNVVRRCNEGARNVERIEEMFVISSQMEFPPHIKEIPIMVLKDHNKSSAPQRWLIRSGELTHIVWRGEDQSKLTFGKKFTKTPLYLFLFTDLLVITKKKSGEEVYTVVDYCKRSLIEVIQDDKIAHSPAKEISVKFLMLLTLLENHENKTVEMLLSFTSETDRQRWMEAIIPQPSVNPVEIVYEVWDCPQVTAMFAYNSIQPDELTLQPGDIINVKTKTVDGWYQGERIRDGEVGWFPGNYTVEIASVHVRSRNLKQRYRLLNLSGSYLGRKKSSQY